MKNDLKTVQGKNEHKTVHRAISPNDNSYVACKVAKRLFFCEQNEQTGEAWPILCFCICFRLIESLVTIHHGARVFSLAFFPIDQGRCAQANCSTQC